VKANELIARQDRVVYILMVLLASLGLLWSFWQHQHQPGDAVAKPQPLPGVPAQQATFFKR
jgi:lipopolysaccharide export system protein LptC